MDAVFFVDTHYLSNHDSIQEFFSLWDEGHLQQIYSLLGIQNFNQIHFLIGGYQTREGNPLGKALLLIRMDYNQQQVVEHIQSQRIVKNVQEREDGYVLELVGMPVKIVLIADWVFVCEDEDLEAIIALINNPKSVLEPYQTKIASKRAMLEGIHRADPIWICVDHALVGKGIQQGFTKLTEQIPSSIANLLKLQQKTILAGLNSIDSFYLGIQSMDQIDLTLGMYLKDTPDANQLYPQLTQLQDMTIKRIAELQEQKDLLQMLFWGSLKYMMEHTQIIQTEKIIQIQVETPSHIILPAFLGFAGLSWFQPSQTFEFPVSGTPHHESEESLPLFPNAETNPHDFKSNDTFSIPNDTEYEHWLNEDPLYEKKRLFENQPITVTLHSEDEQSYQQLELIMEVRIKQGDESTRVLLESRQQAIRHGARSYLKTMNLTFFNSDTGFRAAEVNLQNVINNILGPDVNGVLGVSLIVFRAGKLISDNPTP